MQTKTFNKNDMGQNIYLCWCEATREGVLIDAGCSTADETAIMEELGKNNITVKAILLTHGHYDHITGVPRLKSLTNAKVYCHVSEKQMLENSDLNRSCMTPWEVEVTPDEVFNDGDVFSFGKIALKVLHTPGHTPGGVCYYHEESGQLYAGDTLFKTSIGRTDLPLGDHEKLIRNITTKLLTLPTETIVYPGHGPSTDIGYEKKFNPFLRKR